MYKNNYNNYKKRKYYGKKNTYKKTKTDYVSSLGKKYSGSPKTEIKSLDNWNAPGTRLSTTAQIATLNNCVVGPNFYNRIGKKICMKSLRMRIHVINLPTDDGANISCTLRFMLVYDRQCNNAYPPIADLLTLTNYGGVPDVERMGFINMINSERFVVLSDTVVPIFANGNGPGDAPTTQFISMVDGIPKNYFDIYVKLKRLETVYGTTNNGDITDIQTGALNLWAFSDVNSGGTNVSPFSFKFVSRLRFYDN